MSPMGSHRDVRSGAEGPARATLQAAPDPGTPTEAGRFRAWSALRWLRLGLAWAIGGTFLLLFTDAWERFPTWWAQFWARTQFVPSLLAQAAGAGLAIAAVLIVTSALVCGRVYCAVLCPLGLYQDCVWWIRKKLRPPGRIPFQRPLRVLRWGVFWFAVVGSLLAGATVLVWLDPYSLFGRISSIWFREGAIRLSNAVAPLMHALGVHDWYRMDSVWQWGMPTACVLGIFLLVTTLAAWRGRLYCNTICPVGTLLGWLAQRARWQVRLSSAQCRKCGHCLEVCRAQCIDLRHQTIDVSRCVLCLDCLVTCPERGLHLGSPGMRQADVGVGAGQSVTHPGRRVFLLGLVALLFPARAARSRLLAGSTPASGSESLVLGPTVGGRPVPVIPPGSFGLRHFLRHCTACGLCVVACPTRVLQPSGVGYGWRAFLRPHLDFERAWCNYDCHRCGEVCPTGAIRSLPLPDKKLTKIGEAVLDLELCVVVRQGTDCAACSEHCPTQAVTTKPYRDHLRVPELHPTLCIGCGACEHACPVRPIRAITVRALPQHGRAEPWKDTPPPVRPPDDFPF